VSAGVLLFYVFGALSVGCALVAAFGPRSNVVTALALPGSLLALAGVFVLLEAFLVAAALVLVGAVAVGTLCVGVAALLDARPEERAPGRRKLARVAGVALVGVAAASLLRLVAPDLPEPAPGPVGLGGHRAVGIALYTDYVLLIGLLSLVLLTALLGAAVASWRSDDS